MKKSYHTVFVKIGKIVKLANFRPFFPNLPTFCRFNQNDVMAGERDHDGLSFSAIRKEVITQFLRNWAKSVKLANFCPFLPTFGRFNHNGLLTGKRNHDDSSIGAIRRKVITQFL